MAVILLGALSLWPFTEAPPATDKARLPPTFLSLMEAISFADENSVTASEKAKVAPWLNDRSWHGMGMVGNRPQQLASYYAKVRAEAQKASAPLTICEVGLNGGHSAALFLEAAGRQAKLIMFELGKPPYTSTAAGLVNRLYPGQMELILGDAKATMKRYLNEHKPSRVCDVMSIDGQHRLEPFRTDLKHALKMCKRGSLLLFDDMQRTLDSGVTNPIRSLVEDYSSRGLLNELQCSPDKELSISLKSRYDHSGPARVYNHTAWCFARLSTIRPLPALAPAANNSVSIYSRCVSSMPGACEALQQSSCEQKMPAFRTQVDKMTKTLAGNSAASLASDCTPQSASRLCSSFGRKRLQLTYIGSSSGFDMPRMWKTGLAQGLHYYIEPSMLINKRHDVCWKSLTGRDWLQGQPSHCACTMPHPDAIIIGWSAWDDPEFECSSRCLLAAWKDVPVLAIMNKEYRGAAEKQAIARRLVPSRVLSVIDDRFLRKWEIATQAKMVRWPFGVNAASFSNHSTANRLLDKDEAYSYDVGFSGIVRSSQTNNWRLRILSRLEQLERRAGLRVFLNIRSFKVPSMNESESTLKPRKGSSYRIFSEADYIKTMRQTKIWLSTTGPLDLVGTRFFEVMATGRTLLLCNRQPTATYEGILTEGRHAAMFDSEDEFERTLLHYLKHEHTRQTIVANAQQHVLRHHTYVARVEQLETIISEVQKERRLMPGAQHHRHHHQHHHRHHQQQHQQQQQRQQQQQQQQQHSYHCTQSDSKTQPSPIHTLATLVWNDDFITPALVMWKSILRHMNASLDHFVVLVGRDVSSAATKNLVAAGAELVDAEPGGVRYTTRHTFADRYKASKQYMMFNKLMVFGLSPQKYGKVVYIDADVLAVADASPLWNMQSISAVRDRGQSVTEPELNAGVFVVEPSQELFQEMVRMLNTTYRCGYRATDQSFLCSFFYGKWCELEPRFNILAKIDSQSREPLLPPCGQNIVARECAVLYHFNGPKPWSTACKNSLCYGTRLKSVIQAWKALAGAEL